MRPVFRQGRQPRERRIHVEDQSSVGIDHDAARAQNTGDGRRLGTGNRRVTPQRLPRYRNPPFAGRPARRPGRVGYVLRAGFFLPELAFTSNEMDALVLGLGWVQQRADPDLARSTERALAKVLSARMADPTAG